MNRLVETKRWGLTLSLLATLARAAPVAEPRAARSVHLWFESPVATAFLNEMIVDRTTPGSYFMACGFHKGYFGLQDLGDRRIALFSVWDDAHEMDRNKVPEEQRAHVLYRGANVQVGRFGGEGTGLQSKLPFNWQTGAVYRFYVTAEPTSNRTIYTAWITQPEDGSWFRIASFSTITGGQPLRGLYAFVEDFRRDGKSAREIRSARYGRGWTRTGDGAWHSLGRARFTADATPLDNIDAGVVQDLFYLQHGGTTTNTTPLQTMLVLPTPSATAPTALPEP